jgi:5-hydroxyisourate hydrolase-like protein (transthyretin family)
MDRAIPQQDVPQLYRIAASAQSRLKWTQTSANGRTSSKMAVTQKNPRITKNLK